MVQVLVGVGAAIFLLLGLGHGALTLVDVRRPRWFTPTQAGVREAMQSSSIELNPRANLWRAWLGFNLSHSLGLILFGGGYLTVAAWYFDAYADIAILQVLAIVVAAIYLVLSLLFWFRDPAIASAIGALCFTAAAVFR